MLRRIGSRVVFHQTSCVISPNVTLQKCNQRHILLSSIVGPSIRDYSTPSDAATSPGILDSIAVLDTLSDSNIVHGAQDLLRMLHDSTGMPWWLTIISATFVLRLAVLPLVIHQHITLARLHKLKPEMDELAKVIRLEIAAAARKNKWDKNTAKRKFDEAVRNELKELFVRDNCHPFKTNTAILIQMPIWIGTSLALRNMALGMPFDQPESRLVAEQLSTEGFGWIPNLTDFDHSYILPVGLGVTTFFLSEVLTLVRPMKLNKAQTFVKYIYRGFSILIIPMAAFAPADILLYWTASNTLGVAQNMIMLSPKFRRFIGIPKTETELQHPFRDLQSNLVKALKFQKIDRK